MAKEAAEAFWTALAIYAGLGGAVAAWLILFGLRRFDPVAAGSPWTVKLLLVPGMLALWPVLLRRAFGTPPPEDRP